MTEFDEILGRKDKVIIGSLIIFIFSLIAILSYFGYFKDSQRNSILERTFQGKITSQYTDYKNHAAQKYKLSDGNEIYAYFPKQNVTLQVGDSLIKQQNSIYMLVFRNGQYKFSVDLLNK